MERGIGIVQFNSHFATGGLTPQGSPTLFYSPIHLFPQWYPPYIIGTVPIKELFPSALKFSLSRPPVPRSWPLVSPRLSAHPTRRPFHACPPIISPRSSQSRCDFRSWRPLASFQKGHVTSPPATARHLKDHWGSHALAFFLALVNSIFVFFAGDFFTFCLLPLYLFYYPLPDC